MAVPTLTDVAAVPGDDSVATRRLVARVLAWQHRHPLARRLAEADVAGIGVIALPYGEGVAPTGQSGRGKDAAKPLFHQPGLLPGLSHRVLVDFAARHAVATRPGAAAWPQRDIERADAAPEPAPQTRYLLTAAVPDARGAGVQRLLLAPAGAAVWGRRPLDRTRLAAGAVVAALLLAVAGWGAMRLRSPAAVPAPAPASASASASASALPSPASAASAPPIVSAGSTASDGAGPASASRPAGGLPTSALGSASTVAPTFPTLSPGVAFPAGSAPRPGPAPAAAAARVQDGPSSLSGPAPTPPGGAPRAPTAGGGASVAGAGTAVPLAASSATRPGPAAAVPPALPASSTASARAAASAATAPIPAASPPPPRLLPMPSRAALAASAAAMAPSAAAPGPAPAAPTTHYALVSAPVRQRAAAEATQQRVRELLGPAIGGLQAQVMSSPQGFVVTVWPLPTQADAERLADVLARRGVPMKWMAF